jgi:hypothetical protein
MTIVTLSPHAPKIGRWHPGVTRQTIEKQMTALDREVGGLVDALGVKNGPSLFGVTPRAVDTHAVTVNVLMACRARGFDL